MNEQRYRSTAGPALASMDNWNAYAARYNDATPRQALVEKYRFEGKTYSARRALEDAVEDAMKRMFPSDEGGYVVTVHKVADRAVPESDAVERAAETLCDFHAENEGGWRWCDQNNGWDHHAGVGRDYYRAMARAALAAVPTVQAAAGDDLDALLDSVNEDALLKLSAKGEAEWTAKVTWRNEKDHWVHSEGTGPTRKAAVLDAVRQATGAEGENE